MPNNLEHLKYGDLQQIVNEPTPTTKEGKEQRQETLKKVLEIAEVRSKIPTHKEIMEASEYGSHETQLQIVKNCVERGLKSALGTGARIEGLDQAEQAPRGKKFEDFIEDELKMHPTTGEPQVFAQQIMKKENLFGKKEVPTGEALIVVRMNNGTNPAERTVAVALVEYGSGGQIPYDEDGKLDFDGETLWRLYSEKEYLETIQPQFEKSKGPAKEPEITLSNSAKRRRNRKSSGHDPVPAPELPKQKPDNTEALFAKGKITVAEYEKRFKRENWRSLESHWEQWDKEVEKDFRYGKSERVKEELVHRLEGRYADLLEETKNKNNEVMQDIDSSLSEHQRFVEEKTEDPKFRKYVEVLNEETDQTIIGLTEKALKDYGFTDEDIYWLKVYGKRYWEEWEAKRQKGNRKP